jgi:hypothetical protein
MVIVALVEAEVVVVAAAMGEFFFYFCIQIYQIRSFGGTLIN